MGQIKRREEIPKEYKWNIEKIYKDVEAWKEDFEKLKIEAPKLSEYTGKLSDGKVLLECLQKQEEVSRLLGKLMIFAHMKNDEDTANPDFQVLKDRIYEYSAEVESIEAFFIPEILSLKDGSIKKFIEDVKELNVYKFLLYKILKRKPHTLSAEQEKLIASVSDCLNAPEKIYNMLLNADMTFPNIKDENGKDVELTDVNYLEFIKSKDRRVREEAFKALFNTYKKYKNTLSASLTSNIKNFVFMSKTRKYENSMECSLKPNDIPIDVYNNTVDVVNNNLKSLHRYIRIKKKLLGLREMHMYDLYVSIIDIAKDHIEFNDAVKIVKRALTPLGKEYIDIFSEGINEGWIDIYPNKNKIGGAYSTGDYDTMPYVLLNYNYSLTDVSTLAHEMGHSIHSYYSRKNQPYIYSNYSLFCAEVASTTNESLLMRYLINNENDKNKKLYLINQELEQIRTTVFRQVMFAEFEKITHEKVESGIPLTGDDLCSIWRKLNEKYFGEDMIVDKEIDMEWSRIPHFYWDFYVYQYATGYSAAHSFANAILKDGEKAVEAYKGFLKSGSSDYPINVLRKAGVDMTTPKPLEDTIKRFDELLDMLETYMND